MRIALVYNEKKNASPQGGATDDHEAEWDSPETISAVADALATKHDVIRIEADELAFEKLRLARPELVFNISEGSTGSSREGQIPAMLELLGIPYTGSDPLTLGICLDKSRAKEILAYHGVATPAFQVVETPNEPVRVKLPCLIKPLYEGSSMGIFDDSLARDRGQLHAIIRRTLERYAEPVLVERFLPGREFTVAMLGNGNDVRVLPLVEIRFDTLPEGVNPIYSYEAKWVWDTADKPLEIFDCPANVDADLELRITELCRRAYRVLRCRDWCRIDVRLDDRGEPQIIELNPLPGILPDPKANSCFPKAARSAGIGYAELILFVAETAARRVGLMPELAPVVPPRPRESRPIVSGPVSA